MLENLPVIETHHLSKTFGTNKALTGITISIPKGEVYALIGQNGAGKSTLLKLLVGLLMPTQGSATICGYDTATRPEKAKEMFGYVSDDPTSYDFLSGLEFLELTANLRNIPAQKIQRRIDELAKLFPIKDILKTPMAQYSRGNKQKVSFLAALLSEPPVLLIDEPIVGLDPTSIDIFGATITKFAKNGGTVLMATHTLSFVKQYAERVGILHGGKLLKEEKVTRNTNIESFYQAILTQA